MVSHSSRIQTILVIATVWLSAFLAFTKAQVRTQADDPINIVGTWSTGSGQVSTGLNFFNPLNQTFNVPKVGGQSYSFTSDGHWEQALFIFTADPANPNCAQAQLIWQHGTYQMNSNGSLSLSPFLGDGRQLIQNGCTEVSSSITPYDQSEFMQSFYIRQEWHFGAGGYYLQMYAFDGTPKPWMWLQYKPPQMLPTQQLKQTVYGHVNHEEK